MSKINYIVAFYVGPLRKNAYYNSTAADPLGFMDRQIKFLETAQGIELATFVFNNDISIEIMYEIQNRTSNIPNLEVFYRQNSGFSYGIWNDVIEMNKDKFDYFFLIEDDYIPSRNDFLQPFLDRCRGDVFMVCGRSILVSNSNNNLVPVEDGSFYHPSISNGLISSKHINLVHNKTQRVFRIVSENTHQAAYLNQLYYVKDYTDMGFLLVDTLDEFSSPFMDSSTVNIKIYGDSNNPALIEPIIS